MWDDVVIGKGDKQCSAVAVYKNGNSYSRISHNSTSYWVTGILDIGGTIFKDTPEGIKLTKLLDTHASDAKINNFINSILLKHVNPNTLIQKLENEKNEAFEEGRQSKLKEIRNVLNLYD